MLGVGSATQTWPQASALTCSSRSRRPRSSRISRLRARSSCPASRTGTKERAERDHCPGPASGPALRMPHAPTHSPATLRMLALVGGSGGSGPPSAQVRPSGPSTRPRGQPQVKLPAVLKHPCEQRVTPVLHSSTSSYRKEEGAEGGGAEGGATAGREVLAPPRGRASQLTHVTVLPTPAGGALAPVWPNADASVLAGLGADGCGRRKRGSEPSGRPGSPARRGAPPPRPGKTQPHLHHR